MWLQVGASVTQMHAVFVSLCHHKLLCACLQFQVAMDLKRHASSWVLLKTALFGSLETSGVLLRLMLAEGSTI